MSLDQTTALAGYLQFYCGTLCNALLFNYALKRLQLATKYNYEKTVYTSGTVSVVTPLIASSIVWVCTSKCSN